VRHNVYLLHWAIVFNPAEDKMQPGSLIYCKSRLYFLVSSKLGMFQTNGRTWVIREATEVAQFHHTVID
jgi:hypothetical protein